MKKREEITYEKALKVLEEGHVITCQLGNRKDNVEKVSSTWRLNYLYNLSKQGIQLCTIYFISEESTIPKNAIEVSFDEAYKMVHDGELVYYMSDVEEEVTTTSELVNLRKHYERSGDKLVLYKY